jgi:hypothetical protein
MQNLHDVSGTAAASSLEAFRADAAANIRPILLAAGEGYTGGLPFRMPEAANVTPTSVAMDNRSSGEGNFPNIFEGFDELPPAAGPLAGPTTVNLPARFAQGVGSAVKGLTLEPLLQLEDLGLAGASWTYNELLRGSDDPLWLPDMKSGMADAYANGASVSRMLLQATAATAPAVAAFDMATAAMNQDWGGVAEGAGGLFGGLVIGKGVSKYGGYGLSIEDIGAAGPAASQAGAINLRILTPPAEPRTSATGHPILAEVEYGAPLDYFVEAAKPSASGELVRIHSYENPGTHDPSGGLSPTTTPRVSCLRTT